MEDIMDNMPKFFALSKSYSFFLPPLILLSSLYDENLP